MSRTPGIRTQSTRQLSARKLYDDPPAYDQKGYGLIGGLVSLFFGIIVGIVALRFIFRLLGANESNAVVGWIYANSQPLVSPFFGIFDLDMNVLTGRFEIATLLALVVYGVIASLVTRLFGGYHRPHAV